MTEIRYYHLTRRSLEEALPQLLLKTLDRGWKAVVMTGTADRVEALNTHLWTWNDRDFLPHGSAADGEAPHQPVWLTHLDENPNGATVLFLTEDAETARAGDYELVCRLFDGRDTEALARARACWTADRDAGHRLTYWQQTGQGWVLKAEAGGADAGSATDAGEGKS